MTPEQKEIYTRTVQRLARMGIKDPTAQIVALAGEIDQYRATIFALEMRPIEAPVAPIAQSPKPHYTQYDNSIGRFVVPLSHEEQDDTLNFRVGMTTFKYPDCVFGRAIDRLAELENKAEARWKGAGMGDYYCSICQHQISGRTKFCPNCGAKMDEWEEDET